MQETHLLARVPRYKFLTIRNYAVKNKTGSGMRGFGFGAEASECHRSLNSRLACSTRDITTWWLWRSAAAGRDILDRRAACCSPACSWWLRISSHRWAPWRTRCWRVPPDAPSQAAWHLSKHTDQKNDRQIVCYLIAADSPPGDFD